jgi:hypothetical protein
LVNLAYVQNVPRTAYPASQPSNAFSDLSARFAASQSRSSRLYWYRLRAVDAECGVVRVSRFGRPDFQAAFNLARILEAVSPVNRAARLQSGRIKTPPPFGDVRFGKAKAILIHFVLLSFRFL